MTEMYEPVPHHIQDVEEPSADEGQEQTTRSAYKHGPRALGFAVLLGVVGTVAVLATRNATTEQKTTPFDADALTTLLSAKGDCKDDQMDKVKGAIAAIKVDLSTGVMIRNDKLWKKYFGEEPKDQKVTHIKVDELKKGKPTGKKREEKLITLVPEKQFSDERVAQILKDAAYKLINSRDEKEPLDGKENGKWVARCCNHKDSYHCNGVCSNAYFYNWGPKYDYPGAVHVCPHAWDLDPLVFGMGLFHEAVVITGRGHGSTQGTVEHAEKLAKTDPKSARSTGNNYMLYVAENGLSKDDFEIVKSQWWKLALVHT